ncbi:ribonuclease D [Aeromicrobium sp.]|uniref:ribonuclease D n=1 Tax=Aeromicrobium sp. TaxID=1871063 RepID=UPI004034AB49
MPSTPEIFVGDLSGEFLRSVLPGETVGCDIETSGLDWTADKVGTVQVATSRRVAVLTSPDSPTRLLELLADARITKVFHHAPFDLRFLIAQYGARPFNVACTKVASKILDPDLSSAQHSLKPTLRRHLGVEIDKTLQRSDWLGSSLTYAQLTYAAEDVVYLRDLFATLELQIATAGRQDLLRASLDYLPVRAALDVLGAGDVFSY